MLPLKTFMIKPYSEACEQNKQAILSVLEIEFAHCKKILEIGAGTGQHAVYFARHLPVFTWQCTDVRENLPGIKLWLDEANLPNTPPPFEIHMDALPESIEPIYDGIFSANTAHIMSWPQVQNMLRWVAQILPPEGVFCLYGPFMYSGQHISESNIRFDVWLRTRDPLSGVRDKAELEVLANSVGLVLKNDHTMPVNNQTLVWKKC